MQTLLLDTGQWDLITDENGNIALASEPYAIAQDVASAIRLFDQELWYDTTKGIPYFNQILGQLPPASLIKQYFSDAAMTVPNVVSTNVILGTIKGRTLTGQVQFTDNLGNTQNVSIY